jgi:dihydroorotate dehydrogenase (NAD+) catalytic subunit
MSLATRVGAIALKNPLIAGAGEHLQTPAGIRAALAAGAAAVVAKSINETAAGRAQLERDDYRLLAADWTAQPWTFQPPMPPYLMSRSGLIDRAIDAWAAEVAALDREAAQRDAYVIGSIVLGDIDAGIKIAREFQHAGVRIVELNIGTPYGDEANTVRTERSAERVREFVSAARRALTHAVLWVKLTSQSENVAALAAAAKEGGADATVMIGRPLAMLPDVETLRPLLDTNLGYGGGWTLPLTCYWLARSRRMLGADAPLIGTSGARDGLDIARMLLAGASAVEMCSVIMAGGFGVISHALATLEAYLARKSLDAEDLIGSAADAIQTYGEQPATGNWRKYVPPGALNG